MTIIIRSAEEADIPQLCAVTKTFIEESKYGWSYSHIAAEATWREYLAHEEICVFIALDGDVIAGGFTATYGREFTNEIIGYVMKFYVMPNYRSTRTAILLAAKLVEWFDMHSCIDSFSTSTAEINDLSERAYVKLLARQGYVEIGPTLIRRAVNG